MLRPSQARRLPRGGLLVLMAAVLCGLTACASSHVTGGPAGSAGPGASGTTGAAGLPAISVQRTGGFAGVNDSLTVDPRGMWTKTDKTGVQRTGQLAAADLAALRALATDPRLPAEAARTRAPSHCSDAYNYVVTVGAAKVAYTDCPSDADQPAATIALVTRLQQATG